MAELSRSMPDGPLSEADAASHLIAAYEAVTGRQPSRQLARLMLAQLWMEGARGTAMWRHNWGNLSAGAKWRASNDYWRPQWFKPPEETDDAVLNSATGRRNAALHQAMLAGKAPQSFRAYGSHAEGAQAYLRLLHIPRYAPILLAGEADDPRAYARANQSTGYCPDCPVERTANTLRSLRGEFESRGVFAELGPGLIGGGKSKRNEFEKLIGTLGIAYAVRAGLGM